MYFNENKNETGAVRYPTDIKMKLIALNCSVVYINPHYCISGVNKTKCSFVCIVFSTGNVVLHRIKSNMYYCTIGYAIEYNVPHNR